MRISSLFIEFTPGFNFLWQVFYIIEGNNLLIPLAINSIAMDAKISPIILVITLRPVWLIYFDIYGTDLNIVNKTVLMTSITIAIIK